MQVQVYASVSLDDFSRGLFWRQLFTGCRLCCRAPDINCFKWFYGFHGFVVFFELFSSISIHSFHFGGWQWKQTYSRAEMKVIAQSGGWDFIAKLFCLFLNSFVAGKLKINTSVPTCSFRLVLNEIVLGQNVCIDRGIISGFSKNHDFDMRFTGQSTCIPESLDFHILCLNHWFLFGGQIWDAFYSPRI